MSEEEQELRIQPEVSLDIVPSQQSAEAINVDNNGLPSKTFCISTLGTFKYKTRWCYESLLYSKR